MADEAGGQAGGQVDNSTQQQAPQAPQGGANPAPVPYALFQAEHKKVQTLEAKVAEMTQTLQQYGPDTLSQLQQQLESTKAEGGVRVALARAGVSSDLAMDYLVGRYGQLDAKAREDVSGWIQGLRTTEPAFFGSAPATSPASPDRSTTNQQPAASPDKTTSAPTTTVGDQDAPLSEALIRTMDQATFERRWAEIEKWMRSGGRVG